ncbi:hypothetical protein [Flavivirga aquatica]|nr:hypothetical protein [Flavivirga aquatica]
MKTLKNILIATLIFLSLTAYSKEELKEDDIIIILETENTVYNGNDIEQR